MFLRHLCLFAAMVHAIKFQRLPRLCQQTYSIRSNPKLVAINSSFCPRNAKLFFSEACLRAAHRQAHVIRAASNLSDASFHQKQVVV